MVKTNGWERMVDDWADTDSTKIAIAREIAIQFMSMPFLVNHVRGLLKIFRDDEKARVFPYGKGVHMVAVVVWCMLESRSGDARQRARWCMYRPRSRCNKRPFRPDPQVERVEQVEVVVPERVDPNYLAIAHNKPPPDMRVVVIDDEEQEASPDVQVVGRPVIAGHKEAPIDIEELEDIVFPVKTEDGPRKEEP